MSTTLEPGTYWMTQWQADYKRGVVRVQVLGRANAEIDYYRVRLPNGTVTVASGSMLRPFHSYGH